MATTIPHVVNRLVIDAEDTFDDVRHIYESLVPTIDLAALAEMAATGDLARVQRYTAEHAPHSFVNFWTLDPMPMMRLWEHRRRAITYLMGNHLIAETMFRHDPGIILYAPLRTAIYEDTLGRAHFTIDQPSSKFASFGDARIAKVGAQLDVKVADLLRLMSLPVPTELNE
ncbi:MAG: hypothetical protein JO191_05085 [Mycobacteriaceae bacterium]|nr:hypothetical protein [Mycobacteriaceae bacterium]MBV9318808.1 hypothetical protein [Mycobacterium sp.]